MLTVFNVYPHSTVTKLRNQEVRACFYICVHSCRSDHQIRHLSTMFIFIIKGFFVNKCLLDTVFPGFLPLLTPKPVSIWLEEEDAVAVATLLYLPSPESGPSKSAMYLKII